MFTEEEYISIARLISQNDWDEVNKIEDGQYCITQFSSSLFLSDYKCYKVKCGDKIVVAKITNESELLVLEYLSRDGLPVPIPFFSLVNKSNNQNILLFEEFINGSELGSDSPKEAWINTAVQLAKMHLKYWEINCDLRMFNNGNRSFYEKLCRILDNQYYIQKWPNLINKIRVRFQNAPKTIVHGDAFPTNFLIQDKRVSFLDFGNFCYMPYMIDVARLTCLPSLQENSLLCPFKEEVLEAYYQEIRSQFKLSKEDFMKDVKAAEFIELACIYTPPIFQNGRSFIDRSNTNIFCADQLEKIANDLN